MRADRPGAAGSVAVSEVVRGAPDGYTIVLTAMAGRGVDVDYRPGEALRADLWREYRARTDILKRLGMIRP